MKRILILSANPKNTDRLRLDEEMREIQAAVDQSKNRDRFEIVTRWAVRVDDLQPILLAQEPHIVYFSGHGGGSEGLAVEDELGEMQLVSSIALAGLFKLFKANVECVFLNACYSEEQAKAIYKHIDCVVGMNQAIGDRAAVKFAKGFYGAIGTDKTYKEAFDFGCNLIDLQSIPESSTPVIKLKRRSQSTPNKRQSLPSTPIPSTGLTHLISSSVDRSRIFISYKRGIAPDESVAMAVFEALQEQHEVFIDQTMVVGTPWAEKIELELRRSDFLISFLTQSSVNSEMVKGEIETAYHLGKQQGKPMILPVRLGYSEPFTYPLSAYLNGINWAFWESPADTPRLVQELRQAIAGNTLSINTDQAKTELTMRTIAPVSALQIPRPLPAAQPLALEMPEGTMDPESRFYVERLTDAIAISTIERSGGVTITIKGPRQMGKSSLLIRTKARAEAMGKRVAYLDFQLFERSVLMDSDRFYRQFCEWLTEELELETQVAKYWEAPLGNSMCCARYISRYLLKALGNPLVLVMDEVESMFETEFKSDFFGMLRNWHNNRATTSIWKQLDLVLVTSTEPYHLIENLNQSPFNVGQVIDLIDFDSHQVADLNQRHGSPLNPTQVQQLMALLAGHPYLIRRALYVVASQQMTVMELLTQATADRGPFGDHLRYHLFRMNDKPELVQGLLEVIRQQRCSNERVFVKLRGAGLVRQDGKTVLPRCQLYADYFQEHLHG